MILKITKTIPDWLEATWIDNEVQVHCESFSGHPEHIQMLRDRCVEFGTKLTIEDEKIIAEISEAFIPTPQEELDRLEVEQKVYEAKTYLASTDWIVTKIGEVQIKGEDTTELLSKYSTELIKRDECRTLINSLEVGN